jgi:hypothetical protein
MSRNGTNSATLFSSGLCDVRESILANLFEG